MKENPMKNIGADGKVFELYLDRMNWGKVIVGGVVIATTIYAFFFLAGIALQ
jgi:hypothetical protein